MRRAVVQFEPEGTTRSHQRLFQSVYFDMSMQVRTRRENVYEEKKKYASRQLRLAFDTHQRGKRAEWGSLVLDTYGLCCLLGPPHQLLLVTRV